jgi:hypothetical protein
MGDLPISSGSGVSNPYQTGNVTGPKKGETVAQVAPVTPAANPGVFGSGNNNLIIPDQGTTISALNSPINPQKADATGQSATDLASSYFSYAVDTLKTKGVQTVLTETAKKAEPYALTGAQYANDLLMEINPQVAMSVETRLMKNGTGLVPLAGLATTGYGAVQDGRQAVDSLQNGQYLSGGLYTASSALNAGQFGFAGARDLGIAGGAITSETGIGAVVGFTEAAGAELGAGGTGILAIGLGVSADYAKKNGY